MPGHLQNENYFMWGYFIAEHSAGPISRANKFAQLGNLDFYIGYTTIGPNWSYFLVQALQLI